MKRGNDKKLTTALCNAAALTFEELGFMLPTRELDDAQQSAQEVAAVTVAFGGPIRGTMQITIFGNILSVFGANMLGEECELPLEEQSDVLREIANVICGNMLPELAGPKAVFDIEPLEVLAARQAKQEHLCPAAKACLGIEEGRAEIVLYLNDTDGIASVDDLPHDSARDREPRGELHCAPRLTDALHKEPI